MSGGGVTFAVSIHTRPRAAHRHLVFGRIADMVVKMLLAAQPHLARSYSDAVGSTEGGVR